jgi:isopenicillin-N epimerase
MTNFPQFGHSRLGDFVLGDGVAHLNHGGYGATPRVVLAAAEAARREMEADPSTFFRRDLVGRLRQAANRVAGFLGGHGKDWAFVENATAGLNAVVASLDLQPGDELLCLSQVYGAVGNAMRYFAERRGARVVSVPMPVPFTDPEPLFAAIVAAIGPRTRLAIFDHITSAGAVVLPVRDMAAICRVRGVRVAIDGAHAPGQVPLDLPALGVDWYVGNLHKWAFAAKGTGVIWCAPERQAETHPVAISHHLGQGFTAEFDYSGTRDNSHWLAVPAALDYIAGFGVQAIQAHNRAVAAEACDLLEEAWGSVVAAGADYRAAMASLRLPGARARGDRLAAHQLALELTEKYGLTLGVMLINGALWVRVSAQIYNEIGDYERLAAIGKDLAR